MRVRKPQTTLESGVPVSLGTYVFRWHFADIFSTLAGETGVYQIAGTRMHLRPYLPQSQ